MILSYRWYGPDDAVRLEQIRQIPRMQGIVSALYDIAPGLVWPRDRLEQLRDLIEAAGLKLVAIESIYVHEDIKLGRPGRDRYIDHINETLRQIGAVGVPIVCYNFMPVFDCTRTDLAMPLDDGSNALSYDHAALAQIDLSKGIGDMPASVTYSAEEVAALLDAYRSVSEEQLWENLSYFLERIVPAAEEAGVSLAIHPDDPPWSIFGLPRIITSEVALDRLLRIVDRPANGLNLCTGSLGADPRNDLPRIIRRFGAEGRIHYAHIRNVKVTGEKCFHESHHPTEFGSVDMLEVMRAYHEVGFKGPMRPDHGRMIWGETGRPGYGLFDRALGAMYLSGIWESLSRA
jgi:mannonate dehydratase